MSHDVVVIGAGHNGLVAAAYLARAGKRVLVLEREAAPGGMHRVEEFHPGFRGEAALHDAGWLDPRIAGELGLGALPAAADPDPVLVNLTEQGAVTLRRRPDDMARELARYAPVDAGRWKDFCRLAHKLGGLLEHLYGLTPPQLTSTRPTDLLRLLGLGRRVRGLGKNDMIEFLRVLPMSVAELLDDWFEHEGLKGALGSGGITGLLQGPRSAGTAFVFLHHLVGQPVGVVRGGARRLPAGAMTEALARAATRHGAEIRPGARVERIETSGGQVTGVVLEGGEIIAARQVVSTVDPRQTMLGFVEPVALPPEYVRALQNLRYRGVSAKVNLALTELPRFEGIPAGAEMVGGLVTVSPSLDYLEKAYDAAKHGGYSPRPYLEARFPSIADPSLAPAGQHVMSVWMQYAPFGKAGGWSDRDREALGDLVVETLGRHAPNLRQAIAGRQVLTPADLQSRFFLTEGNFYHGELGLDQVLFMRPVPGWGDHRTPIEGLFLGGSGTHPGGGIAGGGGRLAAREMLKAS